ncbi:MAG: ATP-binding protein, partial [Saprospiraceae bacterium]|nr:ATP-binding protein [Saprospiraceae bacterium]MDW8485362.1 ATP-binding protein [Saprospiraceae bacterium]
MTFLSTDLCVAGGWGGKSGAGQTSFAGTGPNKFGGYWAIFAAMARYFNTTGLCNPEEHYMVDPLRGKYPDICRLIEAKQYFLIHAPRQTGKTTLLHALARRLNAEGKYVSVVCSLESAGYPSISVESANQV